MTGVACHQENIPGPVRRNPPSKIIKDFSPWPGAPLDGVLGGSVLNNPSIREEFTMNAEATAEDLMAGFSFHVSGEEFIADLWDGENLASGNPMTTSLCCTAQC
ncbi:hypothetical protein AB0C51_06600 [Streptomyces pathocidini]|uniref:hypothetical protein n=1 Tax=Streptomyces pathocidini TaxID=1650571 RepID=UPI0033E3CA9D